MKAMKAAKIAINGTPVVALSLSAADWQQQNRTYWRREVQKI